MKLPWQHNGKSDKSDQQQAVKPGDKATAARLNASGEAGTLVLSTENLVKKYRQRTVVNHVSINVHQGEIVGLLGPNGAGKTTTFYMTTGLVTPNEGRVFLNDVDITTLPVYRRAQLGVGYLPQEASVFRTLSVEDNIRTILEMTDLTPAEQKDRLEQLISEFHLQKCARIWVTVFRVVSVAAPRLPAAWPSTHASSCLMSLLPVWILSPWRIFRASSIA